MEAVDDLPLASPDPDPAACAERKETAERIAAALSRLGARCKELFRLKLEGRSYQEIQSRMGVRSINTIYTWDHRCRRHMLELMGGRWEPAP